MSFFWKGRLNDKPSDLLKHYYAETMREPLFLEALHQWDKAQVVVLGEQGIAPPEAVEALIKAVVEMEKEGVVEAHAAHVERQVEDRADHEVLLEAEPEVGRFVHRPYRSSEPRPASPRSRCQVCWPDPGNEKALSWRGMSETLAEVEQALATVQRVLDALTTRGDNEAAFDLAKAQYSASIRTSWPSNLSSLINPLEAVGANPTLKLTDEERKNVGDAVAILKRACNQ